MMGESQSGWLPACSVRRMTGESRNGGPPLTDEGQPHSQTAGVWLVLLFGSSLARGRHPVAPLPRPVLLASCVSNRHSWGFGAAVTWAVTIHVHPVHRVN